MLDVGMSRMVGSFIVVLLTNVTVLLGIIAFVYWVDLQAAPSRVFRWRRPIKVALGVAVLTYLYAESWVNGNLGPQVFGYHWVYINMLAVILFLVVTRSRRWWELALVDVIICLYVVVSTNHTGPEVWISLLLLLGCTAIDFAWGEWTQKSRFVAYAFLAFTGAAAVMLNQAMSVNESFVLVPGFWLRQWLGLIILGAVGVEYTSTLSLALIRNRKMAHDARIDGLTQLENFNAFNRSMERHYAHFLEQHHGYAVFELDVDWFKSINDTYGHLAGNRVLSAVAHELVECTHGAPWPATAYRLGGEEFGVIMDAELDHDQAYKVADHFKEFVDHMRFSDLDPQLHITVSIGQANVHNEHYSFNDAYKQADRNLYVAKQNGRNCIRIEGGVAN